MQDKSFANLLRIARKKNKLKLRELSEFTNISIGYISDLEHKRRIAPDLEKARLLEHILNITDGSLVNIAHQERNESISYINKILKFKPKLKKIILSLSGLSNERLEQINDFLNTNFLKIGELLDNKSKEKGN